MSTTPSPQPTAPQPEKSSTTQQAAQLKPLAIRAVGDDRVQVEFRIEDLIARNFETTMTGHCAGCNGCSGCGH